MTEPSILIIGAGTFGTSIAFHLSKKYKDASKVTIIDRSPSPPEPAAAIDINRVIRTDYANPLYCNLAYEAIHDWFWHIELTGQFRMVGWLMLDEAGSDLSKRIRQAFSDRGSDGTEDIPLKELAERWNVLKGTETEGFDSAYLNPDAGYCNAAGATHNIMQAAMDKGVKRVTADVTELLLDRDSGRIEGAKTSDGQKYTADKVILAAGAWTSSMLSPVEDALDIVEEDRIEQQVKATGAVAAYYKVSKEEVQQMDDVKMPVVVYGQLGEVIPASSEHQLLKYSNSKGTFTNTITTKSGHKISVPADRSQYSVPDKIKQETEDAMSSKVMPEFTRGKEPEYWRICWDALTPTEDWLMCKHHHEKLSNLYFAVGGSFHSYKYVALGNSVSVLTSSQVPPYSWQVHAECT